MEYKIFITAIFFYACLQYTLAVVPVFDVKIDNLLKMQRGLGWPHSLNVTEGHEALMRLTSSLGSSQVCSITTPSGVTFDVRTPPSNRFTSWSEGCGVRVRSVVEADEGRWKLSATLGSNSIVGWSEVFVEKDTPYYTAPQISLQDGETHTDVVLTSLDNTYCVVAQPFADSALVPGHCHVTLDRTTRAVQGNWSVLLGIPGRVQELQVERRVAVETERLDVGYVHDRNANKLNLYCNILHTSKNITFCRFQRTTQSSGYNVIDGLSDGTHSYYGEGFLKRQCGMTIESPTSQDYGTWRCSVGVQRWVDDHLVLQTPMQALISIAPVSSSATDIVRAEEVEVRTVFVEEQQSFTIMCRVNVSLTYCWFQHPNGSQFTPLPIDHLEQPFWYTGVSLQTGDCGVTFSHATPEEAGTWTCHMAPRERLGLEIANEVNVRVTGPLAANKLQVKAIIGGTATLYCHSSNGNVPLDYCRFLSPTLVGLNMATINETITKENAINNRYYFTPEKDLRRGDCSLTISRVQEEDVGEWTCAALVNERTAESRDTITVYIEESLDPQQRADLIGMGVGLTALVVVLAGFLGYRRWGRRLRRTNNTQSEAPIPLDTISNSSTLSDNIFEATGSQRTVRSRSSDEVTVIQGQNNSRSEYFVLD